MTTPPTQRLGNGMYRKLCLVCEAPFCSKRSDAKTCSASCRQFYCRNSRGKIFGVSYKLRDRRKRALYRYLS